MSERRSVWNAIALVATLGLAAVVAAVAVTRSSRETPAPSPSPSATSPSPTVSASPVGLVGDGPYVVYAYSGAVFAYDIASGSTTPLGGLDAAPADERSRQPGGGRVVAFPTHGGSIWWVKRIGMVRIGEISNDAGDAFEGSAVSPDDRRMAVGALAPDLATVVVDLESGHPTVLARSHRDQYPPEALLPVAWSLGGGLIYEIPYCQCGGGTPGIYSLDAGTGASTLVDGTRTTALFRFVVTASGQSLFYGQGTPRHCRPDEEGPCEGPPFYLKRLAAGQRGPETLQRATDARYIPDTISQDGRLLLVTRVDPASGATRTELYSSSGAPLPPIRGIPSVATPVALLPNDVVVGTTQNPWSIVVVRGGRAETIVRTSASTGNPPVYLGWLR